ncbi:I78 family peptidase inhibitor [Paracoccus spongiarum]|uniref:I78 family peptidase inhibitor n=1 Tax=Paracoccus spongiarum TaxID=3064387 RepID=A0ABT9JBL4_9RHOB|nr:I78 family peptidase inhibitor [Paracoccus sp. 2205BS29-5]MDP5307154.1 I78 family peptidase inhibitor [Paracoccus sp. 2205BS29-5]
MTAKSLLLGLVAVAGLAACEPVPPPAVIPDEAADACGAAGYKGLIGQPREVLAQMTFPIGTRMIGPEDAVTADFRPDRLNIEYGRSGRIEKVSCY